MSDRIAIIDKGEIIALEEVEKLIPKGKTLEDVFIEKISKHH